MGISSWPQKLHRFGELSLADKWLLLRAVAWLGIVRIWLAFVPFRQLAEHLSSDPEAEDADLEVLRRVAYAVSVAGANLPWRSDCFPRSIAASKLLLGYGYSSTIHLGVERPDVDRLAGHAWLTCGGMVVTGGEDLDRYVEIHRFNA